jgi:hypothetical protein
VGFNVGKNSLKCHLRAAEHNVFEDIGMAASRWNAMGRKVFYIPQGTETIG